ncbi:MAG: hypothetical protein CSH36_01250 [Thalassolituus sp.]|nr:MAG: hypothetical protein CSH36_01250 [Thalassolituus sp.]
MKRIIPAALIIALVSVGIVLMRNTPEVVHVATPSAGDSTPPPQPAPTTPTMLTHDDHDHAGHAHKEVEALPPELQAYLKDQRLPAARLPVTYHGNGRATVYTEGQWSTVVMAVIDENGTHRTVERRIDPVGTLELEAR